ncbi:7-cyano-7-deazaguanine reductase [Litorivivens lipolytica]|uniref:7-cyano-7-deazaguanine reductase n=1 Tax=Litorivivens lipolytica TaxID=1524264 RepID=A0A7W4Z4J9_9GAMM|nr:NADPH-dependent 7-cyano-7-deazaguanine reductase QueF [Litorivivens lipolytica]MBB3046157.1 7-cyano-7-deazaguanine reductase [Litorivivens lipolytica]
MSDYHDLPLGKHTDYPDQYDPGQMRPIARAQGRSSLLPARLSMVGSDLWNAYELSWLDANGKPQVACAQFEFPADSPNMVESKSFKLYLNSLNQARFESPERLRIILTEDLSRVAGARVKVELVLPEQWAEYFAVNSPQGESLDELPLLVLSEQPTAELIRSAGRNGEKRYFSNLFRSCCPVTGQPDWASVEIELKGELPEGESLLAYLTSFRQNNEFHEQCVERIFCDLSQQLSLESLTVYARYTRRGGLDINPLRSSFERARPFQRLARQ